MTRARLVQSQVLPAGRRITRDARAPPLTGREGARRPRLLITYRQDGFHKVRARLHVARKLQVGHPALGTAVGNSSAVQQQI